MRLLLLMLALLCCGLTRGPTQGTGAADQTRLAKRSFVKAKAAASIPALPSIVAPPKPTFYFAATATDTRTPLTAMAASWTGARSVCRTATAY